MSCDVSTIEYSGSEKQRISDDELYRRYLSGEQSAGDQLMLRYDNSLIAYLAAFIHNEQDAEDLMLDCFTDIFVRKPKIREGNFRPYLFKVARNKANSLWRLRFRRNEFELDESLTAQENLPEEETWKIERNAILERCMGRIVPQYREALYLTYIMNLSYSQTAEVLGCTVKKVDNLLANGKKRMRIELEKEGITVADI